MTKKKPMKEATWWHLFTSSRLCGRSHPATSPSQVLLFMLSLSLSLSLSPTIYSEAEASQLVSMELSCGDDTNTEGRRVSLTEGTKGRGEGGNCMEVHHPHHHEVELEVEFWPLEHPTEPQDEDQPVKCPMLSTSAIPGAQMNGEQIGQSIRKRSDAQELAKIGKATVASEPSVRPLRKRHHTLTHGDIVITPLRTIPPPHNITIFQMLQQQFDSLEN